MTITDIKFILRYRDLSEYAVFVATGTRSPVRYVVEIRDNGECGARDRDGNQLEAADLAQVVVEIREWKRAQDERELDDLVKRGVVTREQLDRMRADGVLK